MLPNLKDLKYIIITIILVLSITAGCYIFLTYETINHSSCEGLCFIAKKSVFVLEDLYNNFLSVNYYGEGYMSSVPGGYIPSVPAGVYIWNPEIGQWVFYPEHPRT